MVALFLVLLATTPCWAMTRAGVLIHNAPYVAIPLLLLLSLFSKDTEGP